MFSSSAAAQGNGAGEAPGAIRNLQQYLEHKRGQRMELDTELREVKHEKTITPQASKKSTLKKSPPQKVAAQTNRCLPKKLYPLKRVDT